MADGGEWVKIGLQAGVSLLSGFAGLVIGVWRAGKRSGKQEAELETRIRDELREEFGDQIRKLGDEMRTATAEAADNRDLLVQQFQEAFSGIRRQIDDNKLHTEENFVRKDVFREFRDEYREDQRRVDDKLDRLLTKKS